MKKVEKISGIKGDPSPPPINMKSNQIAGNFLKDTQS